MTPTPLLLTTLVPDVLHVIVRLSCSNMHSTDADAAAAAQDAATALRLTCRTLRAAVDATVAQLDMHVRSSADIAQAAALFPGLQKIYLWVPAGATTIRVMHKQMPCLTDIGVTSLNVRRGWLDLQRVATQLTSLSIKYSCTFPPMHPYWEGPLTPSGLTQLSELRRLDMGNCQIVPTFGSAACSQLSTLRKLTSLVAGEGATYCLRAMLPALRALKRLKCIVHWFHTDGSGALPVLSELTALEELQMVGRLVGDYMLAFPPSLKEFTFEWAIQRHMVAISGALEAAAATLRGMAGRLTALTVPLTAAEHSVHIQAALLQAGPQLAGTLSSLSFFFVYSNLVELHAAAAAIRTLSAGLQRLDLGLAFLSVRKDYSTAEVQAADAAYQELMRSLPCCQSLRLGPRGAVSHQAIGRELLHAAPDLVSLTLSMSHLDELGEYVSTRVQELSTLTQLTKLHISSPDYHTASCSLQCLSALRRLQVLNVDVDAPRSRTRLATAPPLLSHSTTLTKLRWQCVPTEAVLPCIAELSKLPLRELSLVDIQPFSDSAAFLAPFQQLPQTLRQLLLTCGPPGTWQVIPDAELLPRASPPARLQTTALRKLELVATEVADVTLAGVLQQLVLLTELDIDVNRTIGAESLATMPVSLRRLALGHCASLSASSLACIKRPSALQQLKLLCLPHAGSDGALQLLAPQLPASVTSLEFSGFTMCKVGPVYLTDAGARAFACALAAGEQADRPTLEHLCLDGHPDIGAGTAAALATAPFRHVRQLMLRRGGMNDAGLLHLATHMPQLLHLNVFSCHRITVAGLATARIAAGNCSKHGMVISADQQ